MRWRHMALRAIGAIMIAVGLATALMSEVRIELLSQRTIEALQASPTAEATVYEDSFDQAF